MIGEAVGKPGGSYYTNDRVFLEGQGEDFETTKTFYNIKRELNTEKGVCQARGRICVELLEF